jgi:hypothetical protein
MDSRRTFFVFVLVCLLAFSAASFAAAPFLTAGAFPVSAAPTYVAVGDFNNDAISDVVSASGCGTSISVLLGKSLNSFQAAVNTTVGTCLQGVAVGDFNKDGKLDVALSDGGPSSHKIDILLGNADGTFQAPTSVTVGADPRGIAAADFNLDGDIDLVTANFADNSFSIVAGNGNGTFKPAVTTSLGASTGPVAVTVNDFNFDLNPDVVVANNTSSTVSVLLGKGDGTFQTAVSYAAGAGPVSIASGDLNGDLGPEVVVTDSDGTGTLLFDNRSGKFGPIKAFTVPQGGYGLVLIDLNADGKLDMAVTSPGAASQVTIYIGKGDGTFGSGITQYATGGNPRAIAYGDFSGDGVPDLVVASTDTNMVNLLPNRGNGTFGAAGSYSAHTGPNFVVSADFNKDGKPDIATINSGSQDVNVLLNKAKGVFQSSGNFAVGAVPTGIAAADFNHDGSMDIVVSTATGGGVFMGTGTGSFGAMIPSTNPAGTTGYVTAADVNKDGRPDVIQVSADTSSVLVRLGNGDGTFKTAQAFVTDAGPVWVVVGKFSADANPDLVVVAQTANKVDILLGNGDGTFGAFTNVGYRANTPTSVATADFNKDSKLDIVVTDFATAGNPNGSAGVLLGNGDGTFQVAKRFATVVQNPTSVVVGDFNHDTKIDVLVSSGVVNDALLVGNGDGTLQKPSMVISGENITNLATGDFNADHVIDFVQCNLGQNVNVLLNTQ